MAYRDVVLNSSPWAYWRGLITSGQLLDESPNGRLMNIFGSVLANGTGILPNDPGVCLIFPGLNTDYAHFRDVSQFDVGSSDSKTFEYWIIDDSNSDNPTGVPISIGWDAGGLSCRAFDANNVFTIRVANRGSVDAPGISVRSGNLTHVVAVYDSSLPAAAERSRIYVNSALVSKGALTFGFIDAIKVRDRAIGILLGGNASVPAPQAGTALQAKLQEIAIYNFALSDANIIRHYWAGVDDGIAPVVNSAVWIGNNTVRVFFSKACFQTNNSANFTIAGATVDSATPSEDLHYTDLKLSSYTDGATLTVIAGVAIVDALDLALTQDTATFTVIARGRDDTYNYLVGYSELSSRGSVGKVSTLLEEGEPATEIVYYMRAMNTNTNQYVYWSSSGQPDFEAINAPVSIDDLADIILIDESLQ